MSREIAEYTQRILVANPTEALAIALAEADRERQMAIRAQTDYKEKSEVEFDAKGRIVKANMAGLWRLATIYSRTDLVPEQYRGKLDSCYIACEMALRMGIAPFAFMQASYIVHGKPGIEAKLAIAMINTSGLIKGRIRYRETRDQKGVMTACTAFAKDSQSGDEVAATVTWDMVVAEGWLAKGGSKWKTIPEVMFRYRSAMFLVRQFYPEVLMGTPTIDELKDEDDTPEEAQRAKNLAELGEQLAAAVPAIAPVQAVVIQKYPPMPVKEEPANDEAAKPKQRKKAPMPPIDPAEVVEDAEMGDASEPDLSDWRSPAHDAASR
jgi:hypothetical protein